MRAMTASAKASVLSWRWCASRRRRARVEERHWLTTSVEAALVVSPGLTRRFSPSVFYIPIG
jgi:hypothetical protein